MFGSVRQLVRLSPAVTTVSTGVRSHLSTSARRMGGGHGWSYRTTPYPCDPINAKVGTAIMTFTWWWIFHGIFTEPAHIFPFWDNYPDPEQWTDKQLGIPADDE
eukprot:TRINITY_DN21766_c0_g1_i1.p1 TRINITY_DN21766_c0_g1~~TRINITY_DN21766_c0_g1_i1.p1  ORF type:complete len:104 (-),score=18.36 TRINITY_DN21766_c0_g1_i1:78-389(-)